MLFFDQNKIKFHHFHDQGYICIYLHMYSPWTYMHYFLSNFQLLEKYPVVFNIIYVREAELKYVVID